MWGLSTKLPAKQRVLREIKNRPGITARELSERVTHKFNSRISELRADGYNIEARRDRRRAGMVYGYFLVNEKEYGDEG